MTGRQRQTTRAKADHKRQTVRPPYIAAFGDLSLRTLGSLNNRSEIPRREYRDRPLPLLRRGNRRGALQRPVQAIAVTRSPIVVKIATQSVGEAFLGRAWELGIRTLGLFWWILLP